MSESFNKIVSRLNLEPHPEGGFYRETYRSEEEINANSLGAEYKSQRNFSTCIYFMLTSRNFSAFHRIKQDEIWYFYNGSPILLHMITPDGSYYFQKIGINFEQNEVPQYVVPGGVWFAAEVMELDSYSLIGCTVSPGFAFEDFELKSRNELTDLFPKHFEIIERLTNQ